MHYGIIVKIFFLIYPKYLGTKNENSFLTEYFIHSPFGEISLRIIQIDIMEDDLSIVATQIKEQVEPKFVNGKVLNIDEEILIEI